MKLYKFENFLSNNSFIFIMRKEEIIKYYEKYIEEKRLIKDPYHQIEFIITLYFLDKFLPKGRKLILDAGGGTGRYSLELAKRGYNVILLDLVPKHIKIARELVKKNKLNNKIKCVIGSITDLNSFRNEEFDAILCLGGTLSHLTELYKIKRAIKEFTRITKNGAPIFISVIGKYGVAQYKLRYKPKEIKYLNPIVRTGRNIPKYGFTSTHFFSGKEIENLFIENNLKILDKVGLEGLSSNFQEETNILHKNKALRNVWINILKKTANDPTAYGASLHFMIIGKKNKD